jgi:RNA polymerase sigma-70 factor (sigma-E family)
MRFEQFAVSSGPSLLRFARALVGDLGLAEDLVQEVLIKLDSSWAKTADITDLDAYSRRMIVNQHLSWGRKWFRVRPVAALPEPAPAPDIADSLADRWELGGGLAKLPPRQRVALVLRYYGGLSDAQIAAHMGCSQSTVRSHISRGLASLRIELAEPATQKEGAT